MNRVILILLLPLILPLFLLLVLLGFDLLGDEDRYVEWYQ